MNSTKFAEIGGGSGGGYDFQSMLIKIICAVYGIISLGFFSNVAVAVVVGNILIRIGRNLPNRHMLVYVLALCIVDALVLGTLPMLITQLYLQKWIFGQTLCTVFWTIESINKTLSTFILTCLSFDRYLAVRFPQRCLHIRTVRGALYILCFCIIFAALLLMPVYLHAEITYVPVDSNVENGTTEKVATCAFVGQSSFIFTIFTLCYFVPFAAMSCFYGSMLARLRHKSKKLGLRQGRVRRVTKKTLTLVLLYFFFWTGYWIMTLKQVVGDALLNRNVNDDQTSDQGGQSSTTTASTFSSTVSHPIESTTEDGGGDGLSAFAFVIMCAVHSGCYLNSAINPILYALLNRELRRQHYAAMNSNAPRGSIPISVNGNGAHRCSIGGTTNTNCQQQTHRQPLVCSTADGGLQVKWDEAVSNAPSSSRSWTRLSKSKDEKPPKRSRPFWKLWDRQSSTVSSTNKLGRRESAVIDPSTAGGFYNRLISITSVGLRSRGWSESNSAKSSAVRNSNSPSML